jgi:hypothetical protein
MPSREVSHSDERIINERLKKYQRWARRIFYELTGRQPIWTGKDDIIWMESASILGRIISEIRKLVKLESNFAIQTTGIYSFDKFEPRTIIWARMILREALQRRLTQEDFGFLAIVSSEVQKLFDYIIRETPVLNEENIIQIRKEISTLVDQVRKQLGLI